MIKSPKTDLLLSIIIPACSEAENLRVTTAKIIETLDRAGIPFEIVVIDDHSTDSTKEEIRTLSEKDDRIRYVPNDCPPGFGFAVRKGLDIYKGDAVVIMMADDSDEAADLRKYYRKLQDGYDCVFGTRFAKRTIITGYPWHKLILNRLGNWFIQMLFWLPYNDVTNAFKCYRREAIDGIRPLVSCHFNLTVEMPLKAIVRGYTWCVLRTNWYGRDKGESKWKIKELGSRYTFIMLYVWLEKLLTKGDYQKGKYWLKGR
jgi:dolichol-phosphate mannosyltransferase